MSEQNDSVTTTEQTTETGTETAPDMEALKNEVAKWRTMSRKHEANAKAAAKQLEDLQAANLSDAEKAVAEARAEGERAAVTKLSARLASAELAAEAAKAGAQLPDTEFINMSRFVTSDGDVESDAIKAFVKSLPKAGDKPRFDQDALSGGGDGSGSKVRQLTREDLKRMNYEQIEEARKKGQLNDLLGIS
ncbi:hypothetical protein [Nonomuraea sp. NPDC023979]|uniref:hypothetical protein n=1 Tax=Nonomuraea sp. NPDC023979 TaxID=3154796 RepID=UPI0033F8593C